MRDRVRRRTATLAERATRIQRAIEADDGNCSAGAGMILTPDTNAEQVGAHFARLYAELERVKGALRTAKWTLDHLASLYPAVKDSATVREASAVCAAALAEYEPPRGAAEPEGGSAPDASGAGMSGRR